MTEAPRRRDPDHDLPIDPDTGSDAGPSRRWDVALVVAAGGAIGSLARWGVGEALPHAQGEFPWSTFAENAVGCLLLGALMVYVVDVWRPHRYTRPFLGVGVLGGFTTFSAYTVDTRVLLADDRGLLALTYLFGTLLVGLVATWAGLVAARRFAGARVRPARGRA